jgi:DNA polymerase-1
MKNLPYELITDRERKLGKCLNFGLSYGQEAAGLARNLGIKVHQAEKLMKSYRSNIPEIEAYKQETIGKARLTGFTETYFGRRRFLPDITSPNTAERQKSERQAVNTKIQGTASDILKFSLVKLHKAGFALNTTLHDSVVTTVPDDKIPESVRQVKAIMETIEVEGMTFPVSCKTGKVWGRCQ